MVSTGARRETFEPLKRRIAYNVPGMRRGQRWFNWVVVCGATLACGASKKHDASNDSEARAGAGSAGLGGTGTGGGGRGTSAASGTGGTRPEVGGSGGGAAPGGTSGDSGEAGAVTGGQQAAGGSSGLAAGAGNAPRAGAGAGGHAGSGFGGTAGMAGASAQQTLTSCATWTLDSAMGSTSTAMLTDGGLELTQPAGSWADFSDVFNSATIGLSQTGLTGDFDIVVSFDQFQPGDGMVVNGPLFEAGVWFHDTNGTISQATGTVGQQTGTAGTQIWPTPSSGTGETKSLNHVADATWLIGASGTIELQRTGDTATATTTVDGYTIASTASPFPTEPLTFFLSLVNRDQDLDDADTSVRVTSVAVSGNGIAPDQFNCTP